MLEDSQISADMLKRAEDGGTANTAGVELLRLYVDE